MESVLDTLRDNPLLIVVIAAALFLFLVLVILVIWFMRRRSARPQQQAAPYQPQQFYTPPEPPAFPRPINTPRAEFETSDAGSTAATGMGTFGGRSTGTETEAGPPAFGASRPPAGTPFGQAPAGTETEFAPGAPGGQSPFGQPATPSTPFAGTTPPAGSPFGQSQPQASTPFGGAQPPVAPPAAPPAPPQMAPRAPEPQDDSDATVVMQRAPKVTLLGLLINRKQPSERYDVDRPTVSIGRAKGNVLVLDNPTVSRQHATIKLEGTAYVLYDLGSANGTFVADQRVREPVTLEDGMVVRFGELEFTFKLMSLQ